jgi:NAD-dependent SIR2 family protein deacetylase
LRAAQPNAAHVALASLEAMQRTHLLVTQNVDGLHQRAGSTEVIELHGNIGRVTCLQCSATEAREDCSGCPKGAEPRIRPGGGADGARRRRGSRGMARWMDFSVPECGHCGGMLKPDVVFFGEGIHAPASMRRGSRWRKPMPCSSSARR